MSFSEIIRQKRKEKGLTLDQVAKACAVSKATVQRWESGEIGNPRRDKLQALAGILEVDPMLLVDDETPPTEKPEEATSDYKRWALEVAKRLRSAMDAKGMRAAELSELTGIGKSDISSYLSARYLPRQDRIALMANVLETDPVWLSALDTRLPIVSTEPWDPETMAREPDPSIVLINRVIHQTDRQTNKVLADVILSMLQRDFDENGNKRK